MDSNLLLSPELLRQLLIYDPDTGDLFWKEREPSQFVATPKRTAEHLCKIFNSKSAHQPALTTINQDGYKQGKLLGYNVKAHRVAFAIFYGRWPDPEIDHRNRIRSDNRILNLRESTRSINMENCDISPRNKSGHTGVYWVRRDRVWRAFIKKDGKQRSLGDFKEKDLAIIARREAEAQRNAE